MTINYNRTGAERKALVDAIAAITGAKYLGAPGFAYQVDYFTIDRTGAVTFDDRADSEEVKAYTHLVTALCDMARNQKRITARERDTDNEKYAFRCFLLRLGFIGAEYKEERKILLRNLAGNGAFKSGKRSVEAIRPEPPNAAARVEVQGDPALAEALADELMLQQVNASFGEGAAS